MKHLNISNILFLDIETVPVVPEYEKLSEDMQDNFARKTRYQREKEDIPPEEFYRQKAGIWAEFGKIICISTGFITGDEHTEFRIKSFSGDDERSLLLEFKNLLDRYYSGPDKYLCAHNGKEFDFPYIARRMLIHGIDIPEALQLFGKKPWEVRHLDTMELWKFGDHKHYTSLSLLSSVLGVPSPKDDIDGSMVAKVYYEENDLERIVHYCEKDTVAVARIFLRMMNRDPFSDAHIIKV